MRKMTIAFVAAGLLVFAACGGKNKGAAATPDKTMENSGGEAGSGSGSAEGSGGEMGSGGDMGGGEGNPCGGAADPCGGGE
ncbi:MAG: hypothetical protein K8W52_36170 [Deltaproteobacteria bacterium]|nr:hypothetical protein [Deltaproteobacteria bacterium]